MTLIKTFHLVSCIGIVFSMLPNAASAAKPAQGLYALSTTNIDGEPVALSQYAGKVALIVNTASQCGFTPQYEGLEALYQKYKDKGFVVLAFPSNDFGEQEPGTNREIKSFCEKKFRTTFPIFAKDKVVGAEKQAIYQFLVTSQPHGKKEEVSWNFEKFLVNKNGQVVGRFKSRVKPTDGDLDKQIQNLIEAPKATLPKKS
jgi:glutathione peroxidase